MSGQVSVLRPAVAAQWGNDSPEYAQLVALIAERDALREALGGVMDRLVDRHESDEAAVIARRVLATTGESAPGVPFEVIATFRCEENGIVGTTRAKVHGVTRHDDGVVEVLIDHWPDQPTPAAGESV